MTSPRWHAFTSWLPLAAVEWPATIVQQHGITVDVDRGEEGPARPEGGQSLAFVAWSAPIALLLGGALAVKLATGRGLDWPPDLVRWAGIAAGAVAAAASALCFTRRRDYRPSAMFWASMTLACIAIYALTAVSELAPTRSEWMTVTRVGWFARPFAFVCWTRFVVSMVVILTPGLRSSQRKYRYSITALLARAWMWNPRPRPASSTTRNPPLDGPVADAESELQAKLEKPTKSTGEAEVPGEPETADAHSSPEPISGDPATPEHVPTTSGVPAFALRLRWLTRRGVPRYALEGLGLVEVAVVFIPALGFAALGLTDQNAAQGHDFQGWRGWSFAPRWPLVIFALWAITVCLASSLALWSSWRDHADDHARLHPDSEQVLVKLYVAPACFGFVAALVFISTWQGWVPESFLDLFLSASGAAYVAFLINRAQYFRVNRARTLPLVRRELIGASAVASMLVVLWLLESDRDVVALCAAAIVLGAWIGRALRALDPPGAPSHFTDAEIEELGDLLTNPVRAYRWPRLPVFDVRDARNELRSIAQLDGKAFWEALRIKQTGEVSFQDIKKYPKLIDFLRRFPAIGHPGAGEPVDRRRGFIELTRRTVDPMRPARDTEDVVAPSRETQLYIACLIYLERLGVPLDTNEPLVLRCELWRRSGDVKDAAEQMTHSDGARDDPTWPRSHFLWRDLVDADDTQVRVWYERIQTRSDGKERNVGHDIRNRDYSRQYEDLYKLLEKIVREVWLERINAALRKLEGPSVSRRSRS